MGLFTHKKRNRSQPPRRRRVSSRDGSSSESLSEKPENQYRRGRTIAASSYMRKNAASDKMYSDPSPREKTRKLSSMRRKIMTFLAVTIVSIVVLAGLIWSFTASVVVTFTNTDTLPDAERYQTAVQEYLSNNPTERLRFNMNDEHLTDFVSRKYPEVSRVRQKGFAGFASTRFSIALRKPVVGWQVGRKLHFVDRDGVSFSRNVFEKPNVKIVANSGVEHTPGTAIASARFLGFVGKAVALAQQNGLGVTHATIPAGTSRQVELSIKDVPYRFILSIDRSPAEQVEDMMRSINYFGRSGRSPMYVDIRVEGRAFFRERE